MAVYDIYANTVNRNLAAASGDKVAKTINKARATMTGYNPSSIGTTKAATASNSTAPSTNGLSVVNPVTGKTITVVPAGQGGYLNAYQTYANTMKSLADQQQAKYNKDLALNNQTTNANFDNSARQAYVDYMRKQKALPSQLQALGVNGGATESGLLNLYNNYGNEHAANEQQRAAELAANQRARDEAWYEYSTQYQKDLADKEQTAINNQINEYNNEVTRFSSSVAQYPTTEKGYKQYQKWLKQMESSNDPLKDIKAALIRQQMATQFPNGLDGIKKSGGGSGGGGGGSKRSSRSYSGGSGGSGGDNNNNNDKAKYKTTTTAMDEYYKSGAIKSKSTKSSNKKKSKSSTWTSARDR